MQDEALALFGMNSHCDPLLPLVRVTVWAEELCRRSTGHKLSVPTKVLTENGFNGRSLKSCSREFVDNVRDMMRNCQPKLDCVVKCAEMISMERIINHAKAFGTNFGAATGFSDIGITAGNIQKAAEEYKQIVQESVEKGCVLGQWIQDDKKTTLNEECRLVQTYVEKVGKLEREKWEVQVFSKIANHSNLKGTYFQIDEQIQLCKKLKESKLTSDILLFMELICAKIADTKLASDLLFTAYGLLEDFTELILNIEGEDVHLAENYLKNRAYLVEDVKKKQRAAEEKATRASRLAKEAKSETEELKSQLSALQGCSDYISKINAELAAVQELWGKTAAKFENLKESVKNLIPPSERLTTENACTEPELVQIRESAQVFIQERDRVILDAKLHHLLYTKLLEPKLEAVSDAFFSVNPEQMRSMEEREKSATAELKGLVSSFWEFQKHQMNSGGQQPHQNWSNLYSKSAISSSNRFSL